MIDVPKKVHYARLEFKFTSEKAAWRAYRFLSTGVELGILPKVGFTLDGKNLDVGHFGRSSKIKL